MTYGVEHATVRYGDVTALRDVSVAVPEGEVTAVVGGDGAGKTTLLRALVGEVSPDGGTVTAPDAHRLGYLPATAGSWLELSVQENVEFVGSSFGLSRATLTERADALLDRAGLDSARNRLSRDLSGGMRRKLGFCLAMLAEPDLLVLDEPSTGVDPVSRVDLWRLVSDAAAKGTAVIMSTTYFDEAERCAGLVGPPRGRGPRRRDARGGDLHPRRGRRLRIGADPRRTRLAPRTTVPRVVAVRRDP